MLGDENLKAEYDESLNSSTSLNGNGDEEGYNAYTFRQWKRRLSSESSDSSTFSGKAPTYDFEEYFKSHYSDRRPKAPYSTSTSTTSSTIKSNEDLKRYWQQKEAENLNDSINVVSFLKKVIFTLGIFSFIYILMNYMKSVEDKSNNLRSQRRLDAYKKL